MPVIRLFTTALAATVERGLRHSQQARPRRDLVDDRLLCLVHASALWPHRAKDARLRRSSARTTVIRAPSSGLFNSSCSPHLPHVDSESISPLPASCVDEFLACAGGGYGEEDTASEATVVLALALRRSIASGSGSTRRALRPASCSRQSQGVASLARFLRRRGAVITATRPLEGEPISHHDNSAVHATVRVYSTMLYSSYRLREGSDVERSCTTTRGTSRSISIPTRLYQRLRDEAPLYYNERHDFWGVSRYADVDAALERPTSSARRKATSWKW